MQTLNEVESEIEKKRRDLAKLESVRKNMLEDVQSASDAGQLAIELHKKFCNYNHTDGCGWLYEIRDGVHDWTKPDHVRWHRMATTLLGRGYTRQLVLDIVNIIKG